MTGDGTGERIERAAHEAAQGARLPSAAEVVRRGDLRRRRARTTRVAAVALVVVAGGGGWWLAQDGPDRGVPTLRADAGYVSTGADGALTTTTDPAGATRFTVTAGDGAAEWTPGG
ncbi:hypothetical protein AB2L28_04755 [Kineococcus sp. TBRC 1896]|uniref:Uncharacterized protein n=1 Tax=Kineococcus mangrovi TaxID=1660183 RepID=A0ABV4HYP7_9ACTN